MHLRPLALALATFAPAALGAVSTEPTADQAAFFESKIRPILADNCYKCHSLEKGKAKGDLTLDTRAGVLKGGENGKVIVAGDPAKSPLIVAVSYADPDLQMPPKGEKITAEQVALLTQWVKMGAPDPRQDDADIHAKLSGLTEAARNHWAYLPVTKTAVPKPRNPAWARTPVDAFVLAKLDENKMVPAPDATKEALLRRATYDLTGLPPSPQDVQSFINDTTPQAFAKVVNRLLASPQYGERWGRFWLDTARYSDTAGGEKKLKGADYRYAYAWTYRDWVVKAFNEDLPYDQFIIQQLAADKLSDNAPENLAALGFITVGERFKDVNDRINDRIDAVTKGFLGLTVSCARCHDHKFDPIPTKDYYALHGIFASTVEPDEKPVIAEGMADKNADYLNKQAAIEAQNRSIYYRFVEDTQSDFHKKVDSYLLAARYGAKKKGGTAEQIQARNALQNKAGLDRDTLQVFARSMRSDAAIYAPFHAFVEIEGPEFSTKAPGIAAQVAAGKVGRTAVNPLIAAAFKDVQLYSVEDVAAIYKKLFLSLGAQRKAFVEANAKALTAPVAGFTAAQTELFNTPIEVMPASRAKTDALREVVAKLPNKLAQRTPFQFAKLNELELTNAGAPARAMLVADAARPKDSPVFIRGQAEVKGETVPRRFLEILSPDRKPAAFKDGSGRFELARSIASKTNPLTARVIVNRVWMHHFGEGFVRTPDDLGVQSEKPSHPELLDYLAGYFMDQQWSLKTLHKLIMLSHVYQQSTRTQPQFEIQDPENRLLWRANVRRLDFEAMRDSLLAFSGQLDKTVGGQPINLTDEPYSFRRSVYGYIDRGNLPELMQNFDFSDPDMPNSKRTTTIVPQQALFFMNSAMSVDVTRRIVARPEVTNAPDALNRLFSIYRIIFQRPPSQTEIKLAYQFVGGEDNKLVAANAATNTGSASSAKTMSAELAGKAAKKAAQKAEAEKRNAEKKKGRYGATAAIQNEGSRVLRAPLTPWETYVQALLFSNEAAYVN